MSWIKGEGGQMKFFNLEFFWFLKIASWIMKMVTQPENEIFGTISKC